MAQDEEAPRTLAELLQLSDLTGVTMDELITAVRASLSEIEDRKDLIQRCLVALNRHHGLSYDTIALKVGITRSKANRWANHGM